MNPQEIELNNFYNNMAECKKCPLREDCKLVSMPSGQLVSPLLMIIGDIPSYDDEREGECFKGNVGEILRDTLRKTKILNRTNTVLTNLVKCKPKDLKLPKKDKLNICYSNWLLNEIERLKPKRLLLLGNSVMKQMLELNGISNHRGQWFGFREIRCLVTFHPSYVWRMDEQGKMDVRNLFERDIFEIAKEVEKLTDA